MASAMQELSSFSGFEIFYSFEGAAETHGEEHAQNFCEQKWLNYCILCIVSSSLFGPISYLEQQYQHQLLEDR